MSALRSGELFAGVSGLGMAVDALFGTRPAWFSEIDTAPSRVLAHRHPDVPNLGDVTKVDWSTAPRVEVLAGGFPCQDVSLAGRRKGMRDGTRSGLWSEFARAIDIIRPDWIVIENVRGLLSADAAVDVEPCPLCVGDNPGHVLRALGAVLGDLADLGFDAEWTGIRASDVGAPHGRFRVFILAWPAERTTTDAGGGRGRRGTVASGRGAGAGADVAADGADPGDDRGSETVTLLPTPDAYSGSRGGSQPPAKRRDGGHTVSLADVTEHALLPTPTVGNATGGNAQRGGTRSDEKLLPGLAVDAAGGKLLPTPRASDGPDKSSHGRTWSKTERSRHTMWGPYAPAIARWETVTGRPAPAPVRHDGKGGKARLNPELTEFMMGWPAGWVTDPEIGLTRAEQLKACGNGVVPQQAIAALREMLTRPGVPELMRAV